MAILTTELGSIWLQRVQQQFLNSLCQVPIDFIFLSSQAISSNPVNANNLKDLALRNFLAVKNFLEIVSFS